MNDYWPYTLTTAELGDPADKPVVMGEFHLRQIPLESNDTFDQILNSWWDNGYSGAWSWQYIEQQSSIGLIEDFADTRGCSAGV